MDFTEQMTPQELEQMKALFEQMGDGFRPPDHSVKALCESHRELTKCLEAFECISAVRQISCLETFPDLNENTIRIEVLLHLAVCCGKGNKAATPDDLRRWAELMDGSPMAPQEDPSEDVFIGYVCTPAGGFRVYPGIFSNADFILERLLLFLAEKSDFPGFRHAYESALELLRVSEAIAHELGQIRYTAGGSSAAKSIRVPTDDLLTQHCKALFFDSRRLSDLGIDMKKLAPFLFEKNAEFESKPLFGSPLEHHPLLQVDEGFLVASPSCLCRAAIVRVLELAPNLGGWADTFFEKESAEFFVNDVLGRLGVKPRGKINLPAIPDCLPLLFPIVGQFDQGMPVLALIKSSSLNQGTDLEDVESFTEDQVDAFTQYIADCCAACETVDGFKGGLVLLALSSVGQPVVIGLRELRPNWHLFSAGLADWQTLASDRDFSAKRLWYLGLQQNLTEDANLEIVNPAGLLNLYGFWKNQDFVLLHHSIDPSNPNNMLAIDGKFSQRINVELKSTNDRHCRLSHEGDRWIEIQRQGVGLNPDLGTNLMYCDYSAASSGMLRGCIEYRDCTWWVEANVRPGNAHGRNLLYRLWDCVFNWMELVLPVLSTEHPDWISKRLKLELVFQGVEDWRIKDTTKFSGGLAELAYCVDNASATAQMTFVEGFLEKFYRPDNLAEREIVAAIVRAAAEIAGTDLTESEVQDLVTRVTKNPNTRFFHVVRSSTLESALGGPESAEPVFIPLEEISRVRIGLAHLVDKAPPKRITDKKEAQAFLTKVVGKLQMNLSARLKKLQILPVVSYSFSQLDELSRDSTRWSLSTRSLLALEDGADWLQNRLRLESGRLALAEITNRVLIETAVYSFDPKATEFISQSEHASLLAQLDVMIEIANHRDAIAGGFVGADLKIHPNGMIDYDDSFQQEVFQPYLTSRVDDRIQWNADTYDSNFEPPNRSDDPSVEEPPEKVAFERAFRAEFGFPYETLVNIVDFFDGEAVSKGRAGGILNSLLLRSLLKHRIGLTDPQVASFMERFILPIRSQWDRDLPKGCEKGDVLPWRYFRGLSVLVRPFVEVARSPRQFAISAPHLHRWLHYLTNSILEGHLPDKLFRTEAMKSYLGSVANKKGHEFTKEVAAGLLGVLPAQRVEIKLTALGAPASPDLGDVDVLAWDSNTGIVFLIECKRLKTALTVGQVTQQLEKFRGDPDDMDSLAKHQRRVEWLKANPGELARITGIPEDQIQWTPLLVTSGRVPMSFVDAIDFPKDQVVPAKELGHHVSAFLSGRRPSEPTTDIPD
jgi:hypothetical protein